MSQNDIIISAGHKNFHMLFTAAEMAKRGRLNMLLAGAYPTPFERRLLQSWPLAGNRKLSRFLERREVVPDALIRQSRMSEYISSAGLMARGHPRLKHVDQSLQGKAFRSYGKKAAARVVRAAGEGARVYHYRAGYGQRSVAAAREAGLKTICDHSLVHPSLLNLLIENRGRFPDSRPPEPDGFWELVVNDINRADLILVNSDFVAETFVFMGFDPARIRVVYQGVEDKFLARLPESRDYYGSADNRPLRLLFAGGLVARKGLDEIAAALAALPDLNIELNMAGSLLPIAREAYAGLLQDPRVTYHGMLSQTDLAALMSRSDVFLFPSRAEGSARVIFESMAAGCAVITTRNAGSIVQDGENGALVPVGDAEALTRALARMAEDPARYGAIGRANRETILAGYTQKSYGDNLEKVYQ